MIAAMPLASRVLVIVALACGCGGGGGRAATPSAPPALPPSAQPYAAARFIPARPTYALAARSVRDAQHAAIGLIESVGAAIGADAHAVGALLRNLLEVDPLSPEAVAELGVDPDGGFAVFSENVHPTFVVRLAAPAAFQAFIEAQRRRGMRAQSAIVDGVEVTTTTIEGVRLSWALADGWLWLHAALPFGPDDGTAWLTASRRPAGTAWTGHWQWAYDASAGPGGGAPALVGYVDLHALLASVTPRAADALACVRRFDPIGRLAVGVELDAATRRIAARLSFELEPAAAAAVGATLLPPPEGWAAASAQAPLALQWNADLVAVAAFAEPCARAAGESLAPLAGTGVRAARAILLAFDRDKPTKSRGAISLELTDRAFLASLLDRIPGRSLLERKRTFGAHRGHSLSLPFGGPTIDYVLEDTRALAGLGDGALAAIVGAPIPGAAPVPLFSLDVAPSAMPREAWSGLFSLVSLRPDVLLRWRELHVSLSLQRERLVLEASGVR